MIHIISFQLKQKALGVNLCFNKGGGSMKKRIFIYAFFYFLMFTNIVFSGINEGLIVYLPFNGSAIDESSNQNNCKVNNAELSEDRFGNPDSSYIFNGNAYMDIGNQNILNISELITISVWIKPFQDSLNGGYSTIIAKSETCRHAGNYNLLLFDDNLWFSYYDGVGSDKIYLREYQFQANHWYHLVIQYNYKSFEIKLFINGQIINGSWLAQRNPVKNIPQFTENVLSIGASIVSFPEGECSEYEVGSPHMFFYGIIDDVRIYNSILSEMDINELYGNSAEYKSCYEILDAGQSTGDGYYSIDTDGKGGNPPFEVYCDMTTSGGGWTFLTGFTAQNDYESINRECPNNLEPFEVRSTSHAIALEKFVKNNANLTWYYANVFAGPIINKDNSTLETEIGFLTDSNTWLNAYIDENYFEVNTSMNVNLNKFDPIPINNQNGLTNRSLPDRFINSTEADEKGNVICSTNDFVDKTCHRECEKNIKGDSNNDGKLNLPDVIYSLQTLSTNNEQRPITSCLSILHNGLSKGDGYYYIDIDGTGAREPIEVYCDMTTDGGGWTFIVGSIANNDYTSINNACNYPYHPFEVESSNHADALLAYIKYINTDEWYFSNAFAGPEVHVDNPDNIFIDNRIGYLINNGTFWLDAEINESEYSIVTNNWNLRLFDPIPITKNGFSKRGCTNCFFNSSESIETGSVICSTNDK